MLQSVEVLPAHRASIRRDVRLGCALTTDRHDAQRALIVDLSPRGARVVSELPVEPGDHVMIELADQRLGRRVEAIARVAHVAAPAALDKPSIGLEFVSLEHTLEDALRVRLRNVPPPLPRARAAREHVWIDALVTWEEDLGDRVNVFEISETLAALADDELEIASLASMLSGSRGPYRWLH